MYIRPLLFIIGVIWMPMPAPAMQSLISDHNAIQVIDGDTIQIGGTVVQLSGIDAPELGQACRHKGRSWPCGLDAAYALRKLISMAPFAGVSCFPIDTARTLVIATCMEGPEDLSQSMLRAGHVMAVREGAPYYVADMAPAYRASERSARDATLGIWGSDFTPPWEWRSQAGVSLRASERVSSCPIKGILDSRGSRVYVTPLDPEFKSVPGDQPDPGRIVCSDDTMRQAGWRRIGEKAAQ